ncbi:MAG TPA: DUF6282 family protein [Dehalococcoidia bacterium]|nr:DUF6282 family protein [Dehalococcoidia bacterium]
MSAIERLMRGSIDMHVHHGPDPRVERRLDALQTALQAQEAGMRAIVLKNHDYPTVPVAYIVGQLAPKVAVLGSISLDYEVGGLNPSAVEASARMGARVVWMPTFSAANNRRHVGQTGGISILDEKGKTLPVVGEILEIIKQHDMVLASGHLSATEVSALVKEARGRGLTKIVVTHASEPTVGTLLSLDQQRDLAAQGAYVEHCFQSTMPAAARVDPMSLVEQVRGVGAERCILTTDLGQAHNPAPAEGMRMAVGCMLKCGLSEGEIELLIKENPARLLGLEPGKV